MVFYNNITIKIEKGQVIGYNDIIKIYLVYYNMSYKPLQIIDKKATAWSVFRKEPVISI